VSDDTLDPRLAERLTRAGRAAQALSETLWEALQEELADPRPERVAALSEQLGEVAAVVASLARVDARAREQPVEPAGAESAEHELHAPRATTYGEPASRSPASSREPPPASISPTPVSFDPDPDPTSPTPAVLVDELAAATRPREGDPPRKARPEIEIRDERSTDGPAAWIDSIGRRLERYEQEGAPFAVLLVELVDLERLRHAEPVEEIARLMDLLEDALARVLRPADALTRERPGRYWLLAPRTDGPGARALVERIVRAVRSSASHRGTPLEVAVGVAVCPEDGRSASELAAHADIELYAARAAGRPSLG
jgi:GGDEF domain-containing protein